MPDTEGVELGRMALGLSYDGSPFEGWQSQPHGRTVQDGLQLALQQFTGQTVAVVCAGRTDTGVHARRQVVHFDAPVQRERHAWIHGLNRFLPAEVSVAWAQPVSPQFHARFHATQRHYEYWIWNHPARQALIHNRATWVFRPLNVEAMREASLCLVGTHDFSAFRAAQCQASSPIRTMTYCDVTRVSPTLLRFRFSANAFLHHMIRNLMGSLIEVGVGKQPPGWLNEVLVSRNRSLAAATLGPQGLYLSGIDYPQDCGLPQEPAFDNTHFAAVF